MTRSGPPAAHTPDEPGTRSWRIRSRGPAPSDGPGVRPQATSWATGLSAGPPVAGPAGLIHADAPTRVVAYLMDVVLLTALGLLVQAATGSLLGDLASERGDVEALPFVVFAILALILSAGWFIYPWATHRGTVGMRLLGLRIGHERDGRSIETGQGLVRWLLLGIPTLLVTLPVFVASPVTWIPSVVGMAWLMALLVSLAVSPGKQGYHDRHARTIVTREVRRLGS